MSLLPPFAWPLDHNLDLEQYASHCCMCCGSFDVLWWC